jgi:hypothetical protein
MCDIRIQALAAYTSGRAVRGQRYTAAKPRQRSAPRDITSAYRARELWQL